MKGIVSAALFTLAAAPTFLLFNQPAKAQRIIYCTPVTQSRVSNNAQNYSGVYADGYREGRQSYRNREAYQRRTGGGAFGAGFDDGYYGRPFNERRYTVRNSRVRQVVQQCDTRNDRRSQGNRDDRYGQGNRDDRYGQGNRDDRYGQGNQDDRYGQGNQDDQYYRR